MTDTLTVTLKGTTDLPPGKIAAIVTFLEMFAPPPPKADPVTAPGLSLARLDASQTQRFLAVYRGVGERWLWFSRLVKPIAEVEAILGDPAVEAYAVCRDGCDLGLLELDFRIAGACELGFFGLDESVLGRGAGRWLMNRALEKAWAQPITRFWVHTCTLDHQGAPEFYRRSGFTAYKRGIEIDDDPRLSGHMRGDCAPHHPVIAPR